MPSHDVPEPGSLPIKHREDITPTTQPARTKEPPVRRQPSETTLALFGPRPLFNQNGSLDSEAVTPLMYQLTTIKGRLTPEEAKVITAAQDVIRRHIGHK